MLIVENVSNFCVLVLVYHRVGICDATAGAVCFSLDGIRSLLPLCCSRRYTRFMLDGKALIYDMKHPIPFQSFFCDFVIMMTRMMWCALLAFVVEADGWTRGLETCAYTASKVIICVWYMKIMGKKNYTMVCFTFSFFPNKRELQIMWFYDMLIQICIRNNSICIKLKLL